jgi:hypothetical protein
VLVRVKTCLTLVLVIVILSLDDWANVIAADLSDVEEVEKGSPTQVEDAYPLEYRELDVEGLFRYERLSHGHRFVLSPRLEYGFAPKWQIRLTAPFFTGMADTTGSGNLQAELLWNFQTEAQWVPALAVSVEGDFPTGHAAQGVDTTLKLLASKTLGPWIARPQVHLNLAWTHHGRMPDERPDLYGLIIGYSQHLTPHLMIIADYFRQQLALAGRTEDVLELGFRRAMSPTTVVALGAGYGLNSDSRDFHIQAGIEVTFK